MKARYPDEWPQNTEPKTITLSDLIVNPMLDRFIVLAAGLLTVVVGLVLLIACANLASFLLAQARDRQKEIAIRLAIGAGRAGLVRQLLTESVALALLGCVLAIGLAKLLLWSLVNVDLPLPLPVTIDAGLNAPVLLFALGVAIIAGVLFGLAPALQATRTDVIATIKSENTGGGPARRVTLRNSLVTGQVAVSLVLMVTAGLLLRSMGARQTIEPGFGAEPTAIMQFSLSAEKYNPTEALLMVKRLEERIGRIPGVQAVGVTGNLHLNTLNTQNATINVDGFTPPAGQDGFVVDRAHVDPAFFDAAGIPILRGRNFSESTDREGAPQVLIINQVMADRFWPGQDPIGRTIRGRETTFTVIGVARNAKIRTLGEPPRSFMYAPLSQEPTYFLTLLARTTANADLTVPQVVAAGREVDPDLIIIDAKTMERHLAIMLMPARLGAVVFGAFAILALILALVGVYGVVSYAVSRRLREVGIRISLGARPAEVIRLLMRDGFTLVGIGGVIGIVVALLTARVLQTVLYGIEPIDPVTFTIGPALLLAVGALAAWIPARRASKVDPARVLTTDR
jgi:predicted permease